MRRSERIEEAARALLDGSEGVKLSAGTADVMNYWNRCRELRAALRAALALPDDAPAPGAAPATTCAHPPGKVGGCPPDQGDTCDGCESAAPSASGGDEARCPHANVTKEPSRGRRVCRDCGAIAPDIRPEGTPEWQPSASGGDAPPFSFSEQLRQEAAERGEAWASGGDAAPATKEEP